MREMYYWNTYKDEDTGEETSVKRRLLTSTMNDSSGGQWDLALDNPSMNFFVHLDENYASWAVNQSYYRDALVKQFGPAVQIEGYLPAAIKINVSIATWDPTNYGNSGSNVTDNFTLEILSNGELASDVCNFTTLVITNSLANKKFEYTIDDSSRARRNLQ
jgi:hypothetical protein